MDRDITVVFDVAGRPFTVRLRPEEILHEAFNRALPESVQKNHRLQLRFEGEEVFADSFAGSLAPPGGTVRIEVLATPVTPEERPFVNYGFDHLAIAVADRSHAAEFFTRALGLKLVRDDEHQTVLTSGHTALFMFDARPGIPLSDGKPSRWHHLGFVVNDLAAALHRLQQYGDGVDSDFTLLERNERWSCYVHYTNGDVRFMIQLSEIKAEEKGLADTRFVHELYDYAKAPYGSGGERRA